MVTKMIRGFCNIKSALLVSVLALSGCQPPDDASQSAIAPAETTNKEADLTYVINDDTVTLSADSILNLKSSRYQPSLGLQGEIEPIRQASFIAAKAVTVQKVLVEQGQWVEKGAPLLILERQVASEDGTTKRADPSTADNKAPEQAAQRSRENVNDNPNAKALDNQSVSDQQALRAITDVKERKGDESGEQANRVSPTSQPPTQEQEPALESGSGSDSKLTTITVRAGFAGRVNKLLVASSDTLAADTELLSLVDNRHLQFIATLPIEAEPQLSVGQTVNFTTNDSRKKYTGQISKLSVGDSPNKLNVHVQVLKNDASRQGDLQVGMTATGRVNYGQIAVGTIVPERAIHDTDISALKTPPYQPLAPLAANVWIVKQDQRLTRQPVEVIEYNPSTEQYLIAGVNNDSLICLADLPVESAGKKVVIS